MFDKKLLANEEMRWSYMTARQLLTRLSRITKEEKLRCFIYLAALKGNDRLYDAGIMRAIELGYETDIVSVKRKSEDARKKAEKKIKKFKNTPPERKYLNGYSEEELNIRAIDF